ncbi:MAG: GAF domain-containing protein [Candidatus Natronoplasma sp.]
MGRERVTEEVKRILQKKSGRDEKLKEVCRILHKDLENYDWVGFYLVEDGELVLGPFVGEPTEHTNIDLGEGVCGQAAESEETFVVDDVSQEENYLSCSLKTESEIVVPIFKDGEVVGEIDIDSHEKARFGEEDEELLEEIADMVGKIL